MQLHLYREFAHLLEPVMVEAYGGKVPLNQVATVTVSYNFV